MCKGQYKMKILSNSIVNHQSKTSISTSFKALKVSSKINKEIATSATNVLTIASAVASSAIAGLAMTKKQKEEEEKQLIQQLQNPNGFIIALGDELGTHKNITKEDVYSLAQHFEYAPGFISDLILLKDDNGNPRSIKKNEITKIMQAYQENPELVEELVSEKNNKGEFRYNGEEIGLLVSSHKFSSDIYELAKEAPEKVLKLSQKQNHLGRLQYSPKEIKAILDIEKNGTEFGKKLLKEKDALTKDPRFTPNEIKILIKKHEMFPEIIETLVTQKHEDSYFQYSAYDITKCAKLINDKNIEFAKKLINAKETWLDKKVVPKYKLYEINSLLESQSKSLLELCRCVMKDFRYSPSSMKDILKTFNVESIPQDFVSIIQKEYNNNFANHWDKRRTYRVLEDLVH